MSNPLKIIGLLSKIFLWLEMFDKHIWYFDFPSDKFKRCVQFQDCLKFRFTIHRKHSISQYEHRTWDLPSFTFSLSRNPWGKAVLDFLQGWIVYRNESLNLNNLAWNAILLPKLQLCLLLAVAYMLQVPQGIQFCLYGAYQMVFSS